MNRRPKTKLDARINLLIYTRLLKSYIYPHKSMPMGILIWCTYMGMLQRGEGLLVAETPGAHVQARSMGALLLRNGNRSLIRLL